MISTQFNLSSKNPIIGNHKVYGQELLPGLAYIDLLFQVFRKHHYSYTELELRNLSIYHPLIVAQNNQVLLSIQCFESKEGEWQIRVEGEQQHNGTSAADRKRYITAEMHRRPPVVFEETLDMNLIKQSAKKIVRLDEIYEQYRRQEMIHTGFMKAEGSVYDGDTAAIIDISLGPDALSSAADFMFHPTLIDGSGIGSGVLMSSLVKDEQQLFLPLFYESFCAAALFGEQCFTRIQNSSVGRKKELIYMTMEFFNESGKKVGELKNFINKLVREEGLINPNRKKTQQPPRGNQSIQPCLTHPQTPINEPDTTNPAASTEVESFLRQLLAERLKKSVDQIDTQAGYYEMGLDSPGLLEIVQAIETRIGTTLSPTLLFEYTTIAELSAYLNENYASQFNHSENFLQSVQMQREPEPIKSFLRKLHGVQGGQVFQKEPPLIAIIGMAGRYPGARHLDEFWKNLRDGKDCITEIPKSRWDWHRFDGLQSPLGKNMSKWGGFIDDPDCFDPQFFRISPREAEVIDPQERLFLETCWEAIEDAGYTPKTLVSPQGSYQRRQVGVFVGVMNKDYTMIETETLSQGQFFPLSLNHAPIANRVSYCCNFHGPSMAIDTACSSSLTSLHLALESIRHGESEVALAGGVNLSLHPNKYITCGMLDMHSSDGYCHAFGKGGDGYMSGEGIGAVLLKPLQKAIQDNDHIYAVIKGSTINHGGSASGITVPNPVAQADMIAACLEKTGIHPRTISCVEAHGTGTSLGDPIEIQGLVKAYRHYTQDRQFCSIGSVKSNIGHTESAAGISGLIKVALQLYYQTLVPSLHSEELNPYIDFKQSPFYVQHKVEKWKQPMIMENDQQVIYPRRAGLSSFGASGANAHVILEEYLPKERQKTHPFTIPISKARSAIVPLSARNKEQLLAYARKLLEFLKGLSLNKDKNPGLSKEKQKKRLRETLETKIRGILSRIIHVKEEAIELEQEWNEFGVDPLHITQLREKIQEELNSQVNVNELNQESSIASAAAYLLDHQEALDTYDLIEEQETSPTTREVNLSDLAYTLQVGREAMEERVVFLVHEISALIQKLAAFLENKDDIEHCYQGQVKQNNHIISFFTADEDSREFIIKWIRKGMIKKIAEFWAKGFEVDWDLLYGESKPCRIALPTYPFARERYWVSENRGQKTEDRGQRIGSSVRIIHPLVHENTSDLWEQRFSSSFTGQEFFLADHKVKGRQVLPGVVYLEMARAAVDLAAGNLKQSQTGIRLKNVVWIRPLIVEEQTARVHIGLFPEDQDNRQIAYEIYSESEAVGAEPVVHNQGTAVLDPVTVVPPLDIKTLQVEYKQSHISSTQFYEVLRAMGIDYGPGHQGIEVIYLGPGGNQVLAKLSLPSSVSASQEQFVLHPTLMDSALQASIGLMMAPGGSMPSGSLALTRPALPFALRELEILGNCTSTMWALIQTSDSSTARDNVQELDIDLCDPQGRICVRIKGFSTRVLPGDIQTDNVSKTIPPETSGRPLVGPLMLVPVWDSIPLEQGQTFPSRSDQVVIVGGTDHNRSAIQQHNPEAHGLEIQSGDTINEIAKKLEAYGSIDHILWIAPHHSLESVTEDALIEEQNQGVLKYFRMIKALLGLGYGTRDLGWSVITLQTQPIGKNDLVNPTHASLHGLIGSMAKEYPNWKVRLIDLEADGDWPLADIFTLPTDPGGRAWGYRCRQWYRQQLIPFHPPPKDRTLYRSGGVYVVIGGAGSIGEAWSEYMIRTYQAQIIWMGRQQKDASIQAKLARLAALGPAPLYIAADATDGKSLYRAYKDIKKQYSQIHGVIHAAMVFLDQSLANMEEEQFNAGLSAKVDVSVRMAQVFHKESLDFVLFFSSMIALIKNPGQSHYASGCTFKDAFAQRLSQEWSCAVKVMNWGYWRSPEAVASEAFKWLTQIGIGLLEQDEGMKALETLLSGPLHQIALMKTIKPLVIEGMNTEQLITTYPENFPSNIQNMQNHLHNTKQNSSVQRLKSEGDGQAEEMDELLCRLLWGQLQSIGLFNSKNQVTTELKSKLPDLYDRWLEESITVLADKNYLQYDGRSCTIKDITPMDIDAVWNEWDGRKGQWLEYPKTKAQVVLLEAALRALPDILTGKRLAVDILFPNSSPELVEGIYKNNPIADYFNEVLADIVAAFIQERVKQDSSARIRILEIGSHTGGTGAMVLKKIQPYQAHLQEYCYTDISKTFLMHAEKLYGPENAYLTYQIFDLEAPTAGQGINSGGYDIVIAANVLHASKNIRQALRNTKAALQKNGLLLLNEMSNHTLFAHLTFGLLERWWLYEDAALSIPGSPGLSPQTWQEVLESEGFRRVFFPAQEAHELGQQVIAAESDGIIRQKQPYKIKNDKNKQKFLQMHQESRPFAEGVDSPEEHPLRRAKSQEPGAKSHSPGPGGIDVTDLMVEDHVRTIIRESIAEALKMEEEQIQDDRSISEYGVDSIIAVNLVNLINKQCHITLPTTVLFDYNNVDQLSRHIIQKHKSTLISLLQKELHGLEKNSMESQRAVMPWIHENQDHTNYSPRRRKQKNRFKVQEVKSYQYPIIKENQPIHHRPASIQQDSIAIIGMSGRFAKSKTVNQLWKHLAKGTDLIEEVSRWDLAEYYSDSSHKMINYCNHGSFLEDIDQFDPIFFNISGVEANYMDPQQRFFLEESWKALEDAGYAGTGVQGRLCGVYVGCSGGDYHQLFDDNPPAQAFWGNSSSGIPARISYYLNLQGPAVAIDTSCSSSLVALHLACQGLWARETELALAGGVFIQCSPSFYIAANRAGMLSLQGRCFTFDQRADGFVPGEGVGVVVLKRLKEAIVDGDHIYGVIRGSGINQDGSTNGITAPSANSQERLQRYVYDTFQIHPEQIRMVEAHGTGTILGDPIEYEALTRTFGAYTDKKEYCALGSIKTNIGHAATAAGIAGVIKILLSLKHKQIPPSLNYQKGNSNINFKESPFYVNTRLKDWDAESNMQRCAAISSFGFSGTNAHMVIEEAPELERQHPGKPGYLIVLSARTSKQLRQQVEQLVEYCEQESRVDCGNMSYTLLLGRKHFNHRLACVVRSSKELVKLFKKWLEKGKVSQIFVSERHEHHREQPSLKRYGNQCLQDSQNAKNGSDYLEHLSTIADLYTQGYGLEFEQLFSKELYSRISLPTYPFARERYWVPKNRRQKTEDRRQRTEDRGQRIGSSVRIIHPLLHENTSDFFEQRFSSTFTGREFFLADHVVKGCRVLPGVAYLEMARAAVAQASEALALGNIQLKNVVWVEPIVVGEEPVQVHIRLFPKDSGEIDYEIYCQCEAVDAAPVVHSQGSAMLISCTRGAEDTEITEPEVPTLNLPALQAECSQGTLLSSQCYDTFRQIGIDYGPGHQGIEVVYVGAGQVLAKLSLPSPVSDTGDQFLLHPSLMDSALQASIGLMINPGNSLPANSMASLKPALPFALQELEIFGNCTSTMWALVRSSDDSKAGDKVQKLDIDLCTETGKICVRLKGFSSRVPEGEVKQPLKESFYGGVQMLHGTVFSKSAPLAAGGKKGTLLLYPCWQEQAIAQEATAPGYDQHLVILCEPEERGKMGSEEAENIKMIHLQSQEEGIEKRFQAYAAQVFEEIQRILKDKPKDKVLVQVVVPIQDKQQLFFGLSGLLKTAHLENPKLIGQLIGVGLGEDPAGIPEKLKDNSRCPIDDQILYQKGKRWVAQWSEIEASQEAESIPWKDQGIYLITGGAGSLGLLLAREIARQVKDATLILMGRSPLNEAKQAKFEELQAMGSGARIEYQQVDVTDKQAVVGLIQSIRENFGSIHGIIHCAGEIRDNFIIKKTKEEMQEVLAPKVTGLVNLDQASKDLNLDFFILFSSAAGAVGSIGQADYSTANAFMDAYARYRNALVASKQRQGQTLSINWPLWQEGGMHVDEETKKIMKRMGMIAMRTSTGIQTLYKSLASKKDQVMVMAGDRKRLLAVLVSKQSGAETPTTPAVPEENKAVPAIGEDLLREKATNYFKKLVSSIVKLPVHRIEADAPMEKYGIDSIMAVELINQLEKTFGSLSKTLLFEYQDIRELTGYFLECHRDQLIELLGIEEKTEDRKQKTFDEDRRWTESLNLKPTLISRRPLRFASPGIESREEKASGALDIAIIGLSGRYPQARNIQEFWKNLQDGKDCIIEIPKDRWDHSLYFDKDKDKPGKTYSKWGGFLEDVTKFDPQFFNISPREAQIMDPQERLFLECVFETLEDAGYTRETISENYKLQITNYKQNTNHKLQITNKKNKGSHGLQEDSFKLQTMTAFNKKPHGMGDLLEVAHLSPEFSPRPYALGPRPSVGVYVGVMYEEYQLYGAQETIQGQPIALPGSPSSIANRVSYFCNFHGPSMAVDTMCSSSLTAVYLACESLQRGRCEMAIAGGVNISIHPNKYLLLGQGKFVSSKGRCESFGQGGDGYVPGEGVGAVLLKPLSKAIAHRDHIYGIIKAAAINHGGKTNGYSVPNPNAQADVIGQTFKETRINPRTISYIEAHGTGTSLGDPIEITGLTKTFQEYTKDKQFCAIGSVKSNIGHCESAAGIAGVTKVLLQLQHGQLVPSLHSKALNPNINFSNTPFVVQQELAEWKRPKVLINGTTREYPRIAGISAFGAGGANAHIVIEEYIPRDPEQPQIKINTQNPAIIVLSARIEEQLQKQVQRLLGAIKEQHFSDTNLADMAYTLQVGREPREERLTVIVSSIKELEEKLAGFLKGEDGIEDLYRGQVKHNKETLAVFAADEELQEAIDKWIQRRKLEKLLALWVKGLIFDWNKLYDDNKPHQPRRISLPTYPFTRKRYWWPGNRAKSGRSTKTSPITEGESQSSIARHSLQPGIAAKSPNKPERSNKISLPSLSSDQIKSFQSAVPQTQPSITLSSPGISLTQARINNESKPVTHQQSALSAESLEEELTTSFAETFNIKRSDVDVDDQLIDMGLDAMIGMKWIETINQEYGLSITPTIVYDYPSIRAFAGFLEKELNKKGNQGNRNPGFSGSSQFSSRVSLQSTARPATGSTTVQGIPGAHPGAAQDQVNPLLSSISAESLQEELRISLAEALYMEQSDIDVDKKFIDMGLDSIVGVEWIRAINKHYGVSIVATQVYEYPSIRAFAGFLEKELHRAPSKSTPSLSLDEVLQQVKQRTLDIDQAEELVHQFLLEKEQNEQRGA